VAYAKAGAPQPQSGQPKVDSFEVASIRRNKKAEETRAAAEASAPGVARPPGRARTQPGGMVNGSAMTVRELIRDAYGYRNRALSDVTGGPDWIDKERYDVLAKAATEFPASVMAGLPPEAERLLKNLLEKRLNLKIKKEVQQRPIYEMTLDKGGKPGAGLKASDGKCIGFYGVSTSSGGGGDKPASEGAASPPARKPCPFTLSGGVFSSNNMTMEELARFLAAFPSIGTTVIDKTALSGGYDITVRYQLADVSAQNTPEMASRPLFNQAFEQQLGLKLTKKQGPVEILVVEGIERPSEN